MKRYIPMTPTAQQATWSKLSNNTLHIPTQFLIDGDREDGYDVMNVDEDECGFTIKHFKLLSNAKQFCDVINKTGKPHYGSIHGYNCSVGSFAWAHITMPIV